jgi:hypothetical protein
MTYLYIAGAFAIGYAAGYFRAKWTETDRWRPTVQRAFNMGRRGKIREDAKGETKGHRDKKND